MIKQLRHEEDKKPDSIQINRKELKEEIKKIREQLNSASYDNQHEPAAQM